MHTYAFWSSVLGNIAMSLASAKEDAHFCFRSKWHEQRIQETRKECHYFFNLFCLLRPVLEKPGLNKILSSFPFTALHIGFHCGLHLFELAYTCSLIAQKQPFLCNIKPLPYPVCYWFVTLLLCLKNFIITYLDELFLYQ